MVLDTLYMYSSVFSECLPVKLACIDVSPEGKIWLKRNVLHNTVWFHLLHRTGSPVGFGSQLYSKIEIPQVSTIST